MHGPAWFAALLLLASPFAASGAEHDPVHLCTVLNGTWSLEISATSATTGEPLGPAVRGGLELFTDAVDNETVAERLLGVFWTNASDGELVGHQAVSVECAGLTAGSFKTATQAALLQRESPEADEFQWEADELRQALREPQTLDYGLFDFSLLFAFRFLSLEMSGVSSSQGSYHSSAGGFGDAVVVADGEGSDWPAAAGGDSSNPAAEFYNLLVLTERHIVLTVWQGERALTIVGFRGAGFGSKKPAVASTSFLPMALGIMGLVVLNLYRSQTRHKGAKARRRQADLSATKKAGAGGASPTAAEAPAGKRTKKGKRA